MAELAADLAAIPSSQLAAMKLASTTPTRPWGWPRPRRSGRSSTGSCATRPTRWTFIAAAAAQGVGAVVERRDHPFGDYGQAPEELRPDPGHVIVP